MAQHLWRGFPHGRLCEVCHTLQDNFTGKWRPPVSSICTGDDEDGDRRVSSRPPNAPIGGQRVLEVA